jgi:hypothetical protein
MAKIQKGSLEVKAIDIADLLDQIEANNKARAEAGEVNVCVDEFAKRIRQAALDVLAERVADESTVRQVLNNTLDNQKGE